MTLLQLTEFSLSQPLLQSRRSPIGVGQARYYCKARQLLVLCLQISNATTVHVRRPGNPKKWRARILCEGIICDLALLTVDEEEFWSEDLMSLQFVDVPELQVHIWA